MSITTPMSCSISTTVVPNSSFTSRMKRHMSCFSSTFMPAIGSSRSSMLCSAGSARPRSEEDTSELHSFPTRRSSDLFVVHVEDEAAHVLLFLDVHAGHRLVQQQHAWLGGKRAP